MTDGTCNFMRAWVGPCDKPKPCPDHAKWVCCSCGSPATHDCAETSVFVCDYPLCDDCEHAIAPDGTNGGNFDHCRKAD